MKKVIISLLILLLSSGLLAEWGDEEENGGVYQWRPIKPYRYEPYAIFYKMSVLDSTHALALVQRSKMRNLEIWETKDAAKTWEILYSELGGPPRKGSCINFPDETHIYLSGWAQPWDGEAYSFVIKSSNLGTSWDTLFMPHWKFGWSLTMYDSLIGVCTEVVKVDSTISYADPKASITRIHYTEDGCKTWKEFRPDSIFEESLYITQFYFFSPEHFGGISYDAGDYGDGPIYIWTEDKGETWDITYISRRKGLKSYMTPQPKRMYFFSDSIGWLACIQRKSAYNVGPQFDVLFKTTDGGRTWRLKYKELNVLSWGLMDIKFLNEKEGIAVGSTGKILRTTDGGETWTQEYGKDPEHIKCPEGQVTSAHLYTHGYMNIEYFGSKPIIWTRNGSYSLWEYDPFTVKVGVTEEIEEFKLYPNPVSSGSYIHLNYKPAFKAIAEIYSLTGELIYKKQLYGDHIFIPTEISAGTYILVLNLNGEILAREKFIVK